MNKEDLYLLSFPVGGAATATEPSCGNAQQIQYGFQEDLQENIQWQDFALTVSIHCSLVRIVCIIIFLNIQRINWKLHLVNLDGIFTVVSVEKMFGCPASSSIQAHDKHDYTDQCYCVHLYVTIQIVEKYSLNVWKIDH